MREEQSTLKPHATKKKCQSRWFSFPKWDHSSWTDHESILSGTAGLPSLLSVVHLSPAAQTKRENLNVAVNVGILLHAKTLSPEREFASPQLRWPQQCRVSVRHFLRAVHSRHLVFAAPIGGHPVRRSARRQSNLNETPPSSGFASLMGTADYQVDVS